MAPREFRHGLEDMLSAIDGKCFADYAGSWVVKHAVQCGIKIISEASRLLPGNVRALRPEIPWERVRAIGNVLRHEYHGLSDQIIWRVATDELPRLKDALLFIQTLTDEN